MRAKKCVFWNKLCNRGSTAILFSFKFDFNAVLIGLFCVLAAFHNKSLMMLRAWDW